MKKYSEINEKNAIDSISNKQLNIKMSISNVINLLALSTEQKSTQRTADKPKQIERTADKPKQIERTADKPKQIERTADNSKQEGQGQGQ